MNRYTPIQTNQNNKKHNQLTKTIVKADIIVQSGIAELDQILGGFKAGEITYIDGNSTCISKIPDQLCVNTYKTFNSNTLYLDGGICVDPYQIANYANAMEMNSNDVLNHVQISRAFTVYQLSTFINHMLEQAIQRYEPRTLIIGRFPSLYQDPDVAVHESRLIMKNNLAKLHEITSTYNLITVLTNSAHRLYSNTMRTTLQSSAHETIKMTDINCCTYIDILHKQTGATRYNIKKGQSYLDMFGVVM